MINEIAHHPTGPSKLENFDPKSRGCYAFLSSDEESPKATLGSLKHRAVCSADLELLGGNERAIAEVQGAIDFIGKTKEEYPDIHSEITLETEKFFGTIDHLGLCHPGFMFPNEATKALIIDLKFGAWSVTPAAKNLQGWAYAILVFHNYPEVRKIKVVFYSAPTGLHTEAVFYRRRLPWMEKRIYRIIERAEAAREAPHPEDFHPDALNCSFCIRINCPARLALMGTLVTQWTGKPVQLPHLNLLEVNLDQLSQLKKLTNVFKAFANAVDQEAKRRAFDEGTVIEGYEITERNGPRTIVGAENLELATRILSGFSEGQDWGDFVASNAELSVSDLEKKILEISPKGSKELMKKKMVGELEKAGLINSQKIFYLSAIRE